MRLSESEGNETSPAASVVLWVKPIDHIISLGEKANSEYRLSEWSHDPYMRFPCSHFHECIKYMRVSELIVKGLLFTEKCS